jgi:hypothetical protein
MSSRVSKGLGTFFLVLAIMAASVGTWSLVDNGRGSNPTVKELSPLDKDNDMWSVFLRNTEQDLLVTTASSVVLSSETKPGTISTSLMLRYLFTNASQVPLMVEFIHGYFKSPGDDWGEFTHIGNLSAIPPFGLQPGQSEGRELQGSVVNDDSVLVVQIRYSYLDSAGKLYQPHDVFLELSIRPVAGTPATPTLATPITAVPQATPVPAT